MKSLCSVSIGLFFQLEDVTFCRTKKLLSGVKQFYRNEIQLIEIISVPPVTTDVKKAEPNDTTKTDTKVKFNVGTKEFEKIKKVITNHSIINRVGKAFDKALDDILKQEFIGLNVAVAEGRENGEVTLIGISTHLRMYVFNIKAMDGIHDRLKDILQSKEQVKVIHGAKLTAEILFRSHGVLLKGIFDTMVVHSMLGYSSNATSLRECITEHMILPSEFYEEKFDYQLGDDHIKNCIITTAILLKFHDFLTEQLLKNAYTSFTDNMNYCRKADSLNVQLIYRDDKSIVERLSRIQPFKLNLIEMN